LNAELAVRETTSSGSYADLMVMKFTTASNNHTFHYPLSQTSMKHNGEEGLRAGGDELFVVVLIL
jgi:hypothetical protein